MSDYHALVRMAAAQYGLLSTIQLQRSGHTPDAIRHLVASGRFQRLSRRVLALPGADSTYERTLLAACLETSGVASHRSALRIHRLRSVDEEIEVTIPKGRRSRFDGAIIHRSVDICPSDVDISEGGLRVTSLSRSLVDSGLVFPEHEVRRMVDHAITDGIVGRRQLWILRRRVAKQGRNGCGILGRVLLSLPKVSELLESGPEVLLARIIHEYRLPEPWYQHPVVHAGRTFRLDAAYPRVKAFIEVDGSAWHSSPDQIAADDGRQNSLVAAGWRPIRFTYSDLRDHPSRVARTIKRICAPFSVR